MKGNMSRQRNENIVLEAYNECFEVYPVVTKEEPSIDGYTQSRSDATSSNSTQCIGLNLEKGVR